jgi:hypothetical protein
VGIDMVCNHLGDHQENRELAMAPIPGVVVGGTLAAAVLFALVLDLLKIPVFAQTIRGEDCNHGVDGHSIACL